MVFDYEGYLLNHLEGLYPGFERFTCGWFMEQYTVGVRRSSNRNKLEPDAGYFNIGFRVARDPA